VHNGDGDETEFAEELPVVDTDKDDEGPRGSIGTSGGVVCPECESVDRRPVRTTGDTDAFQCNDCGTQYDADGKRI
jgi:hypothetical protein